MDSFISSASIQLASIFVRQQGGFCILLHGSQAGDMRGDEALAWHLKFCLHIHLQRQNERSLRMTLDVWFSLIACGCSTKRLLANAAQEMQSTEYESKVQPALSCTIWISSELQPI